MLKLSDAEIESYARTAAQVVRDLRRRGDAADHERASRIETHARERCARMYAARGLAALFSLALVACTPGDNVSPPDAAIAVDAAPDCPAPIVWPTCRSLGCDAPSMLIRPECVSDRTPNLPEDFPWCSCRLSPGDLEGPACVW